MAIKLLTIIGARPQFIKASALSAAIDLDKNFEEIVIHTGQHFDTSMSEVFFEELGMKKPKYNLGIHGLTHGAMTGQMLEELEKIMLAEEPDVVILYGDTNSTLAGALAAAKLHIKVAHVEAGLRSFNWQMPEEQNRIITDRLSQFLFVPSQEAIRNLIDEGITAKTAQIVEVGDIMYDVFLTHKTRSLENLDVLNEFQLTKQEYFLVTVHRQENVDNEQKLTSLFEELDTLHEKMPVVMPLHPRTAHALKRYGIETKIILIKPLSYLKMLALLLHSKAVLTDSGGLQKEAFYANKMCYTLRNETEWKELVELNANVLIKDFKNLKSKVFTSDLLKADFSINPYGDGKSASKILKALS